MKKRLCAVMAALVLCGSSVLSFPVPVRAASLPIALADEGTMLLWDIFMQCLVAAGVTEALDYNDEVVLFTAFVNDVTLPENACLDGVKVRLADGSTMSMTEALANGYTEGTGALQIPDEETWSKFRVIDGGGSGDNQEPEGPYEEISDFTLNGAFFSYVADWIVSLWNGEVEGVNPDDYYFPSADEMLIPYQFKGAYEMDADGNYILSGNGMRSVSANDNRILTIQDACSVPIVLVDTAENGYIDGFFCTLNYEQTALSTIQIQYTLDYYNSTWELTSSTVGRSSFLPLSVLDFYINIPFFTSEDAALAYLQGVASEAPLNGLCYDYAALAEALPAVLSPLADVAVSPNALPAVSAAIRAAAHALPEPEPALDPTENTEAYVQAVTEAVVAVAPDVAPDAAPETDPALDPTDIEIVNNYKFDLTQVFPFCLPFDLIRFLEALAAEPEAPRFEIPFVVPALDINENLIIDLSFMDEAMEIIRFCELVGFCFALIMLTPKMIKW